MFGIQNFVLFVTTVIFFTMTPGIDTIFVINKSISKGKRAAIYSTFGIIAGLIVHTLLAALGLSVLITQSAMGLFIVQYLGAAYLFYLGIKALLSKESQTKFTDETGQMESRWTSFRGGMVTNVLNPKVALFFLSFFPQFIQEEHLQSSIPFIILGIIYALLGLVWFIILGYFSSIFADKFKKNQKINMILNHFSGVVFILMGIKIALTD